MLVILIVQQDGIAATATEHARPLLKKLRLAGKRDVAPELPEVASERVSPKALKVTGLTVRFGGVTAVNDVSLEVNPGEVVGLIGPNGAGKTTIIDAVTGFVRPTAGRLRIEDVDVSTYNAGRRARTGLRRSFQSLELFEDISVMANISAGSDASGAGGWIRDLFWPKREHRSPLKLSTAIREFQLEDDLIKMPARAAVRASTTGGHRQGHRLGPVDHHARRARRRSRRCRESRAGSSHPPLGRRMRHGCAARRAQRRAWS